MGALARLRRLLRRPRRPAVEIVYSARYRLDLPGLAVDPRRGEKVLGFLASEGLIRRGSVLSAPPMPLLALCRVHDVDYLESLSDPETLTRILGFRPGERERQLVVEVERRMCGGTRLAVERARASGEITLHVGGGLHHAFPDRGERFCLFHDIAAAVAVERRHGFAGRVLIVDCDVHDGDGTRAMFAADETVHTFSIHNQSSGTDPDAVESTSVALGAGVDDATFLVALERHLPPVVERFRPELAIYLAGVDAAADDFLGDWAMTADGLFARDRRVTELLREGGGEADRGPPVPLVIVAGGGYGKTAWTYTARYAAWLLSGREIEPPAPEEVTLARYRRIARGLLPRELTGDRAASGHREGGEGGAGGADGEDLVDPGWSLTEEDVLGPLAGGKHRFLDYYTPEGVELALERTGLFDRLRKLGFTQPTLDLELDNPAGETVRVFDGPEKRELLIEVRARRDRASVPGCETLTVEWLLLQNPRLEFTRDRAALPGQQHPGLGLLEEVVSILVLICDRLHLDGIHFVPSHYHLTAQSRRFLRFLDPVDEGRFRAVQRAVVGLSLGDATRAIDAGRLIDEATGEPFRLPPMPMVLPVSNGLRRRVEGEDYERRAAEEAARHRLRLEEAERSGGGGGT